ncbi:MAG: PorV/PorQ family protein [Candidatus Electryonea clarkiae]|nr:PorV/PorQ family protein [Candidatus Electryonea clarkiae]MDP8285519.1 PorV/PorQ family protein [Candidatus Electryonea clarkiae]
MFISFKHYLLIACFSIIPCLCSATISKDWIIPIGVAGPGVRANSLGGAFSAKAEGNEGTWWNPAGSAFINRPAWTFQSSIYLPEYERYDYNAAYFYSGLSVPTGDLGVFGVSIYRTVIGRVNNRCEFIGPYHDFFGDVYEYSFSYADKLSPNNSFGINLRLIHSNLSFRSYSENHVKNSMNVDFGFLSKEPFKNFSVVLGKLDFGVVLSNVGTYSSYFDSQQSYYYGKQIPEDLLYYYPLELQNPPPVRLRLGAALNVLDNNCIRFIVLSDISKDMIYRHYQADPVFKQLHDRFLKTPLSETLVRNSGLELSFFDHLFLRTGYTFLDFEHMQTNYGIGIKLKILQLDLAINKLTPDISYINSLGLTLIF